MTGAELRQKLASLVEAATDGEVPAAVAMRAETTLDVLGVSSLGFLRLVDAVETEFHVELDLGTELGLLDSVDVLAAALVQRGVRLDGE